jgi:hypothetical protein
MGLLKKMTKSGTAGNARESMAFDAGVGPMEATWEFMTATTWDEDGSERKAGTIMLFADGGFIKAMMNDKDAGRVAFITIQPDTDIWEALEEAVLSARTDWRNAKVFPTKGR